MRKRENAQRGEASAAADASVSLAASSSRPHAAMPSSVTKQTFEDDEAAAEQHPTTGLAPGLKLVRVYAIRRSQTSPHRMSSRRGLD